MVIDRTTPFDQLPELLSPEEVTAFTGLSRWLVYQMVAAGELPCRRFRRRILISKEALLPRAGSV